MPTTITAYNTFLPNTKARASEVNTNFSNYRGDLLPIEENTAAASNLSHNIGSTDHFWRSLYFTDMYFGGSATGISIEQDTATGSMDIFISGSTATTIRPGGITPTSIFGGMTIGGATTISLTTTAWNTVLNVTLTPGSGLLKLSHAARGDTINSQCFFQYLTLGSQNLDYNVVINGSTVQSQRISDSINLLVDATVTSGAVSATITASVITRNICFPNILVSCTAYTSTTVVIEVTKGITSTSANITYAGRWFIQSV